MSKTKSVEQPDVSAFDYNNLNGDSFAEYQKLAASLQLDAEYEFDQYMASGVFEWGINKQTGDKVLELSGIKINSNGRINTAKMQAGYAHNLNDQILSRHGDGNSRYYLLAKKS